MSTLLTRRTPRLAGSLQPLERRGPSQLQVPVVRRQVALAHDHPDQRLVPCEACVTDLYPR